MKRFFLFVVIVFSIFSCAEQKTSSVSYTIDHHIVDPDDSEFGYYLSVQPESKMVKGVMVLLPGFGQKAEDIFMDSSLHKIAYEHDILTIGFSGRTRMTADDHIQNKLNQVLEQVKKSNGLNADDFVIGGFSAGGVIALRYAELCKEFPDRYPINPQAVFMADSPVDMYLCSMTLEEIEKTSTSKIALNEAKWVKQFYQEYYGATPQSDPEYFKKLSPFSIDKQYGENEKHLKDTPVRAYHDIDVNWRLKNRNQTTRFENYVGTSELINRLILMGNQKAEFMQSYETGYRRNGQRHPHSWSIIDPVECIEWITACLNDEEVNSTEI